MDTSTKFFRRVEIFRLEVFQSLYSELRSIACQVPRELMSRMRCKMQLLEDAGGETNHFCVGKTLFNNARLWQ